jgi:hypothetical protein
MINGDDVGARTKPAGYWIWSEIAKISGMPESLGKTYFSREFININSTNFRYVPGRMVASVRIAEGGPGAGVFYTNERVPFVLTRYINMGLVRGLKRSGGGASLAEDGGRWTVGARYREMMRTCPEDMKEMAHREFVKHNNLDEYKIPWFMPEWIGGLGLLYEGTPHRPSDLDRRIATRILLHWHEIRPFNLSQSPKSWRVWELAQKAAPRPYYSPVRTYGTMERTEMLGEFAVNLLFDSNYSMDDLYNSEERGGVAKRCLRHNERLWRVTKDLPPPIDLDRLSIENKFESTQEADEQLLGSPRKIWSE